MNQADIERGKQLPLQILSHWKQLSEEYGSREGSDHTGCSHTRADWDDRKILLDPWNR